MAPPTQLNQELPDTLPGDFVQWDEASQSAQAAQSPDAETGTGFISKPATEGVEAHRAGAPSVNLPRGAALSPSASERRGGTDVSHPDRSSSAASPRSREIALPLHAAGPAIDKHQFSESRHAAATMAWLHQTLRANANEITRVTRRKWPVIAAVSAALVVALVAATIPILNRGGNASAKPSVVPASQMTTLRQPQRAAPSPADSRLAGPASTAAPNPAPARINSEAAVPPFQNNVGVSHEQAQTMDRQLHTPAQLHMKATLPDPASLQQGFDSSAIHGLENSTSTGLALGNPKGPKVQIASQQSITSEESMEQVASHQAIAVPPGVALSLLVSAREEHTLLATDSLPHLSQAVQNRRPIYPLMAKSARVSGIVVLAGTISTVGKVEHLRVVSGPVMLRESALEAARTWRFKPYLLNNQPTALETTITLHFSLN